VMYVCHWCRCTLRFLFENGPDLSVAQMYASSPLFGSSLHRLCAIVNT
jgi:hypothetical protein